MTKYLILLIIAVQVVVSVFPKELPDYIQVCKRDQSTINACVRKSIETLKPKLAEGMPEFGVPPTEPFYIPELVVDSGNLIQFQAVGKDVKVSGAGNFTIKNVAVDLESLRISARVRFPRLHFVGRYSLDARLLVLPLHGAGTIVADAVRCDTEIVLHSTLEQREGVEYIQFTKLDVHLNVKDYSVRLEGLFDGNKALGDAANEAINQSREEILRATKPYAERTVSKLFLDTANKIASSFPFDQLIPK
ncbi:hypothetical protein MSG28_000571 [Choristoneura fumiferana]|uniref:Uncharacterized protein n=2 Tax=Choristoneura fumiferana TaxID=7141 RepID=A0ACC0K176_CHOFU|nr:hypothetical protein MSG28_000570 [Choristoneura fumiferana]KAI8430227.1 hypothetical protein MSG28_000571 [Choristoneura fumiferana]